MEQNDISRIMDLSDPDVLADNSEEQFQNVFRRHIKDNPKKELIARHKIWLSTIQHEYPMPYIPYRIGVYIRYHNQTKHEITLSSKNYSVRTISLFVQPGHLWIFMSITAQGLQEWKTQKSGADFLKTVFQGKWI